jgi:hypothetical protein
MLFWRILLVNRWVGSLKGYASKQSHTLWKLCVKEDAKIMPASIASDAST